MQCQMEQSIERLVDRLDKYADNMTASPSWEQNSQNGERQIQHLERFADGVYRMKGGQLEAVQDFAETVQLTDTKSSSAIAGEILGATLTGTVAALVARFVPIAGIPAGLLAAIAAYLVSKKWLKSGFGHAVARGVIIGGGTSFVYPMTSALTAGLSNLGGGMGGPQP